MPVVVALALVLAACGSHPAHHDPDAAVDATPDVAPPAECSGTSDSIAILKVSDKVALFDVTDGGTVPLTQPPQLGEYLFVGARVMSASTKFKLTGDLRDPIDHTVLSLNMRDVTFVSTGDGWVEPMGDIVTNTANVPVCPNFVETHPMNGVPFVLELAIADEAGNRIACFSANVIPTCAPSDAECPVVCGPQH